jgi:small subunit ribosomal protein S18
MKLDEDVLRYLLVLNEGEPTSGMSVMAKAAPAPGASEESAENDKDERNEEETEAEARSRMSPPEFSGGRGHRRRIDGPPIALLNYKDVATLSRFITEQGKLLPRRTTRVAAGFQRKLGRAVKRARYLALLPYMRSHGG